jgi:hypothetical protein
MEGFVYLEDDMLSNQVLYCKQGDYHIYLPDFDEKTEFATAIDSMISHIATEHLGVDGSIL